MLKLRNLLFVLIPVAFLSLGTLPASAHSWGHRGTCSHAATGSAHHAYSGHRHHHRHHHHH